MERAEGRSCEAPHESLAQDLQLLGEREADAFAEDVVLLERDLVEQAAVDGDERPQRGLAIFVDERDELVGSAVELAGSVGLEAQNIRPNRGLEAVAVLRQEGRRRELGSGASEAGEVL